MNARGYLNIRLLNKLYRLIIFVLLLICISVVCFGRQSSTGSTRRSRGRSPARIIQLPDPKTSGSISVEQALIRQHDIQIPTDRHLPLSEISQLAWAGLGSERLNISNPMIMPMPEQAPPFILYFVMPDGLYLYNPLNHTLQQSLEGDIRGDLAVAVFRDQPKPIAGCQIIIAGRPRDIARRNTSNSRQMMLMQAGQGAQSIQLQAMARDLAVVPATNFSTDEVRRVCRFARNLDIMYILFVGYPAGSEPVAGMGIETIEGDLRALIISGRTGIRDEEILVPKTVLGREGVQTFIVSDRTFNILGLSGAAIPVDFTFDQIKVDDFDAFIFVGGTGIPTLMRNKNILDITKEAVNKNKVVAAIGTGPAILASAGVITGVKVTGYIDERDRLIQAGANYTGNPVERYGKIVTAIGPDVAELFSIAIIDALAGL